MTPTAESWGTWFATTMRALGYAQDIQAARALGVSPSTIGRWKRDCKPSIEDLHRVSEVFGVGIATLLVASGLVRPDQLNRTGPPELPELSLIKRAEAAERRVRDLATALAAAHGALDPVVRRSEGGAR